MSLFASVIGVSRFAMRGVRMIGSGECSRIRPARFAVCVRWFSFFRLIAVGGFQFARWLASSKVASGL
jgi:hypothetical protein